MTFLFSDIEGSTRRWEEEPEAMNRLLADHDRSVADSVAGAGGRLIKTMGDGALAVFDDPNAAVAAAIAISSGAAPLRVRIGVHTGPAQERDGDYFGPTLNRAARLAAAAHGGQIVVSGATAGLLANSVELLDLGRHRLRDLEQPEHVHQILAEGVERSFPPLRSLDAFHHNLPMQRTPLVGRGEEITKVRKLLHNSRLVTLTGVGGCGKTRLALAVAEEELERWPDGVFFVDLAPITDPALIEQTATRAAGISRSAPLQPVDADFLTLVGGRRMMLVLDNCEHLIDACADLADGIFTRCPNVAVLATSREALAVDGERTFPVPSQPLDEALELFVARATTARGDFVLDESNSEAVTEVCSRLDGIPLAIELAAARVSHLSVAEIASRLDDRFRLLVGGARRRAQRQQTLQAAMDWSFDLLTEEEATLLRRLSVFSGVSLAAAETVCDATVDQLASLVAKSLVVAEPTGPTRYRLLETVRLYAQGLLVDAGEAIEMRARHRDWFLDWLESFDLEKTWSSYTIAADLEMEHDNLRSSLEWCVGEERLDLAARVAVRMSGLWILHGHIEEGTRWTDTILRGSPGLDADLDDMCRALSATLAFYQPDYERTAEVADDLVRNPRTPGSFGQSLGSNLYVMDALLQQDRALTVERANQLLERFGEWASARVWGEAMLAFAELIWGNPVTARDILERASIGLAGDDIHTLIVLAPLAAARSVTGDHLGAIDSVARIRKGLGRADWFALGTLEALVWIRAGRRDEAERQLVERARRSFAGRRAGPRNYLVPFAALELDDGNPAQASRLLARAWANMPLLTFLLPFVFDMIREVRSLLDPDEAHRCRDEGRAADSDEMLRAEIDRYS